MALAGILVLSPAVSPSISSQNSSHKLAPPSALEGHGKSYRSNWLKIEDALKKAQLYEQAGNYRDGAQSYSQAASHYRQLIRRMMDKRENPALIERIHREMEQAEASADRLRLTIYSRQELQRYQHITELDAKVYARIISVMTLILQQVRRNGIQQLPRTFLDRSFYPHNPAWPIHCGRTFSVLMKTEPKIAREIFLLSLSGDDWPAFRLMYRMMPDKENLRQYLASMPDIRKRRILREVFNEGMPRDTQMDIHLEKVCSRLNGNGRLASTNDLVKAAKGRDFRQQECIAQVPQIDLKKITASITRLNRVYHEGIVCSDRAWGYSPERIRMVRKAVWLTQKELAERVKIPAATMSAIERGTRPPATRVIVQIADELGINPLFLFHSDKVPFQPPRFDRDRFIAARKNMGLTQEQLADKAQCDFYTLASWERGDRLPSAAQKGALIRIARVLGVTFKYLMGLEEVPLPVRFVPERFVRVRKYLGWTKLQAARALGVEDDTIRKWERGEIVPANEQLELMTQKMGVTLEFLSGKEDMHLERPQFKPDRLMCARIKLGLTQDELESVLLALGEGGVAVSFWENGGGITEKSMAALAKVLGVTTDYLLGLEGEDEPMPGLVPERVAECRSRAGLSLRAVSERAVVATQTIVDAEKGRRPVKVPTVRKLAQALDVSYGYLMGFENVPGTYEVPYASVQERLPGIDVLGVWSGWEYDPLKDVYRKKGVDNVVAVRMSDGKFGVPGGGIIIRDQVLATGVKEYGLTVEDIRYHRGGFWGNIIRLVTTPRGVVAIKRIEVRMREIARFVVDYQHYLQQMGEPVPILCKSGTNGDVPEDLYFPSLDEGTQKERFFQADNWVSGREIRRSEASAMPETLRVVGRELGKIHELSKGYRGKRGLKARRYPYSAIIRYISDRKALWWENLRYSLTPDERAVLEISMAEIKAYWSAHRLKRLPQQPIVGDLNFANMIFDKRGKKIRAIFDWEDARIGCPLEDFFPVLVHTGRRGETASDFYIGPLKRDLDLILEGYREVCPLSEEQYQMLPAFFAGQMMIHVSNHARRLMKAKGDEEERARIIVKIKQLIALLKDIRKQLGPIPVEPAMLFRTGGTQKMLLRHMVETGDFEPMGKEDMTVEVFRERRSGLTVKVPCNPVGFRRIGYHMSLKNLGGLAAKTEILKGVSFSCKGERRHVPFMIVQEAVTPLPDLFKHLAGEAKRFSLAGNASEVAMLLDKARSVIDQFVFLQQEMWARGVMDVHFSLDHYGLSENGDVVLMNLGNVRAVKRGRNQEFRHLHKVNWIALAGSGLDTKIVAYYENRAYAELMRERRDLLWGANLGQRRPLEKLPIINKLIQQGMPMFGNGPENGLRARNLSEQAA